MMSQDQTTVAVELRHVVKKFGSFTAIRDAHLSIYDNEFFTLLGPSGCGKTTLLRLIAGFEEVTQGQVRLFGKDLQDLPPNRRPVNTVFQNYALFPHMTIAENVGFGVRMKGASQGEMQKTVERMLELVRLTDHAHKRPSQLSGGQQQRAALVRAIAPSPRVLLLDEPLSALDLKLRQAMRIELKQLQQETGITFIFVTHDQEEALSMSDRIAVMSDGVIQQVGPGREIYEHPRNRTVANFIGETNLLGAIVHEKSGSGATLTLEDGSRVMCTDNVPVGVGESGQVLIRPEKIVVSATESSSFGLHCKLASAVYLGTDTQYVLRTDGGLTLTARMQNVDDTAMQMSTGSSVVAMIEPAAIRWLADGD
ncbi:MAG: ABC transporter ATP-binding protein [Rhodobacteraceae bacterium]|nr:ABC transporter ATP-binding protein [Paracoccaceae bacterium]